MCLHEKKEAMTFAQGGTYEQYRRWISGYPDLFGIQSLNAVVVRRSGGDNGISSQAPCSEQDHGARALCAATLWILRRDRFFSLNGKLHWSRRASIPVR